MIQIPNRLKKEYEDALKSKGEGHFYKFLLGTSYLDRKKHDNFEMLLLDRSEAFFALFRQTGNENFFTIGRILRRVAHKLYHFCLRNGEETQISARFLIRIK